MCTVTFVPVDDAVFITSNRDEKTSRKKATPPAVWQQNGARFLFPKDGEKGGSWIAARNSGDVAVLLNGAFTAHVPQPRYRQSRGTLLLRLMQAPNIFQAFIDEDLQGIEPFTLVLFMNKRLWECRWTGNEKSAKELLVNQPYIWSSATLYNGTVIQKRESWFAHWLRQHKKPSQADVIRFHTNAGDGDCSNDVWMKRESGLQTVSVTSITIERGYTKMFYLDALDGKTYQQHLMHGTASTRAARKQKWQRFWIRLTHWEYWPFSVVYTPVYFYWAWLSLRARSPLFFSTSNPTIRNSGFLMESKKEIYDLLPSGTYPATVLVQPQQAFEWVRQLLEENSLQFPLIVKPDIGLRGMSVALVKHLTELEDYHRQSRVDYLIQAYVSYPEEVGIFYYRLPGQSKGKVTGIVQKEFLKIRGDGQRTMEELLQSDKRFALQLPVLRASYCHQLVEVLPDGEEKLLVPFGNHSRGAKFIDATHLLNEDLQHTIDAICTQVDGFYFGRLDIKYENWEALCRGRNFSIIELNGAGSEPAHIYDPKHSIFFAWKEIMRHLHILYKVSMLNKKRANLRFMTIKQGLEMLRANKIHVKKIAVLSN